jgi:hypothetical protein
MNITAYIDPGSGSYLVQLIIAGILGIAFYFKAIWAAIKSFFGGKKDTPLKDKEEKNE